MSVNTEYDRKIRFDLLSVSSGFSIEMTGGYFAKIRHVFRVFECVFM
jgi:hypothetical protein